MISFYEYLIEQRDFNLNDAKGKLYEILVGSHIKHGADDEGYPANFLTHYRDEEGKSPEAVHNYLRDELRSRHPGMYEDINEHAREAAEHLKEHVKEEGYHTFHDIAWTSQPSDHKSFTGVEDPNADADIMIKTNKGPIGVSLKYGSEKQPNLRNPGLNSIESLAGLKKGEITSLYNEHQNNIRDLGYTGTIAQNHKDYKSNKNSEQAKAAEQSSLETRRKIAQKWQNGYANKTSEELRKTILDLASPETVFPNYRMHTRTGLTSGTQHHVGEVTQELEDVLSHYAEFKSVPHEGSGITAQILGRHHGSDDFHPVVEHGVKGTSGPMKGMSGTTKLKLRAPAGKVVERHPDETAEIGTHGGKDFYGPGEK